MIKRFALTLLLCIFAGAGGVHAADYKEALIKAREGKYAAALSDFKMLGTEGHAGAQFSAGLVYHLGRGVAKDLESAYTWYKKAALQKHPGALNNIGMMYLNGEYVAQNQEMAFKLFEMASPEHAQARDNMAQMYENGWWVDQDIELAKNFYEIAGDDGYIIGWHHLGQLYEKDYPDEPKDLDMAVEWYTKAAQLNYTPSRTRLAIMGRLPPELAQ